jgi:hypothetical protein
MIRRCQQAAFDMDDPLRVNTHFFAGTGRKETHHLQPPAGRVRERMLHRHRIGSRPDHHDPFNQHTCSHTPNSETARHHDKPEKRHHIEFHRLVGKLTPRQDLKDTVGHGNTESD